MRPQDLIDFARRDWPAVAELKAVHWLERTRGRGREEVFRAAEELRRFATTARPGWPDEEERAADLASHAAVAESLRRVAAVRPR
jgi:hypothetical protein